MSQDMQTNIFAEQAALDALQKQSAICTRDEHCTAPVDGHHDDCPKEQELKDTFGY